LSYRNNYQTIDWSKGPVFSGRIDHAPKEKIGVVFVPDIQPYQNMLNGEWITGRRQHKEFLKQHNYIEVGNEKIMPKKPERLPDVRHDMLRVYEQLSNK